jgi:hypothetical protein
MIPTSAKAIKAKAMMTDSQSSVIFAFMVVSPEGRFGEFSKWDLFWGESVETSLAETSLPLPVPSTGQTFLSWLHLLFW